MPRYLQLGRALSQLPPLTSWRTFVSPNRWHKRWRDMFLRPTRVSAVLVTASAVMSSVAQAQDSYPDPVGSGVLVSALGWLQGTLLGTVATVTAVIAVATVGFMMLTGRINWRYGITVIVGCFILFGASSIVAGIHSTATLGQ